MANLLYANNAAGTLSAPLTNASTTLTLNVGQAALFPVPTPPQVFYATLTDAATQTLKEIVQVTAVSGNVFSITRAQDGTSALSWNTGDIVQQCTIALELRGFENAAEGNFAAQGVAVTPSTTLGVVGTATNDNANAGSVGEYLTVGTVTQIPMPSITPVNIITLALTAGDWDVGGTVVFSPSFAPSAVQAWISASSATLPNPVAATLIVSNFLAAQQSISTPTYRFSLASTTTIYLQGLATYSSGSVTGAGVVWARRAR